MTLYGMSSKAKSYPFASVPISYEDQTSVFTVAVAEPSQMYSRVLFSVPLTSSAAGRLVKEQFKVGPTEGVSKATPIDVLAVKKQPKRSVKHSDSFSYFRDSEDEPDNSADPNYVPSDEDLSVANSNSSQASILEAAATADSVGRFAVLEVSSSTSGTSSSTSSVLSSHSSSASSVASSHSCSASSASGIANSHSSSASSASSLVSTPSLPIASSPSVDNTSQDTSAAVDNKELDEHASAVPESSSSTTNPLEDIFLLPDFNLSDVNQRKTFKSHIRSDNTLKELRGLGHHELQGYYWDEGMLLQKIRDECLGSRDRIVVPKYYRKQIMSLAHSMGHFSPSRTSSYILRHFTWPHLQSQVAHFVRNCSLCARYNKQCQPPAPVQLRLSISEPFSEVALDIIGPLPKSKKGYTHALIYICMASRWPEVIPLERPDAASVAAALS